MSGVRFGRFEMSIYSTISVYITIILSSKGFCLPIKNGFSLRFNPISAKEEVKMKAFGSLFMKIPQEVTEIAAQELFSEAVMPKVADVGIGCSNQIVRLLYPSRAYTKFNNTKIANADKPSFINLPIVDKTLENYKIIVATAPKSFRLGKDDRPFMVYIVFHDEDVIDSKSIKIPSIYFVRQRSVDSNRKENFHPIFLIDSNRTVTGLKSTEVSKFVKFRNKLKDHFKLSF